MLEDTDRSAPVAPSLARRRRRRLAIGIVAVLVAAVLLFVALDSRKIYAPGAGTVAQFLYDNIGALRGYDSPIGFVTVDSILRKTYALIAFALVGACFAPLFVARERFAGAALAVTQFSTLIEILQKFRNAHESLASNLFDILCGTIGGAVGAAAFDLIRRGLRAYRTKRSQRPSD